MERSFSLPVPRQPVPGYTSHFHAAGEPVVLPKLLLSLQLEGLGDNGSSATISTLGKPVGKLHVQYGECDGGIM